MLRGIVIIACVALFSFFVVNQSNAQDPEILPPEVLLADYEAFGESLKAHDTDGMASHYAENVVYDYVPLPAAMNGVEEVVSFFEGMFLSFPDFTVDDGMTLVSGNIIVKEHNAFGTHLGEFNGIPATGNPIQTPHIDIIEYEGDKIKRIATYLDIMGMLIQMGVMPAPELPALIPSFVLPDPEPNGLSPLEANEEIVAAYNDHDLERYAKILHSDVQIYLAPFGVPMDRNAFIASLELYFLGFPDIYQDNSYTIEMGDGWVLAELAWTGTNDGPYFGTPATGNSFTSRGTVLARYDADGLMTNLLVYWDEITGLAQLGLFPPPPDPEVNKAVVLGYFQDVWNQGNIDAVEIYLSEESISHVPEGDQIGIEGGKQHVAMFLSAFPDVQFTFDDIIAEGDIVALRWTSQSTHTGELMGIPPTGLPVPSTGILTARVANGKLMETWSSVDLLGMMQQLGAVIPGRPTPEDYLWSAPSEVTGEVGDPEANKMLVMRYANEVFNQGNLDTMDEIFNAEPIAHNPAIDFMYGPSTLETAKQSTTDYLTAFPDFHVTVDELIAEGDRAVGRWTFTGTHQGELMGIPPTGRQVMVSGHTMYRFADGKIVETWWAWDTMGMMQQLTAQIIPEGVIVDGIVSPSLEGNPLGDPAEREVIVYLPPSYDQGGRFPVVYLLHGFTGNARTFVSDGFTGLYWPPDNDFPEGGLYGMLNEMIASSELGEMIVVMPDGSSTYGGSFYTNSELNGNYEDYIVNDLVSYIDNSYRTIPNRNSRAIMGHSMGGYGAMKLAMKHPEVFGAVAAHSGLIYIGATAPMMPMIIAENPDGIMGPDPAKPMTSAVYALSAAFSPNLANPPFFVDLPFEYPSGAIIDEVWNKFMENDPFAMINTHGASLASMRGIFIDIGDQDELVVPPIVDAFHQALAAANIDHEYEIFAGDHFNRLFERLGMSLKFLSDVLVSKEKDYTNVFFTSLSQGLNMISVPLEPTIPFTARSLAEYISATVVIRYDESLRKFMGFNPALPGHGFSIEGGKGYIVNVPDGGTAAFTGAAWTNNPPVSAAPPVQTSCAWAFAVSGSVIDEDILSASDDEYIAIVKNQRTGKTYTEAVDTSGYFTATWADLSRKAVIEVGDKVEVVVTNRNGEIVSGPFIHDITLNSIRNAVLNVYLKLGDIIPAESVLLQNYPNPFNPETWIPYHLSDANSITIRIHNSTGQLIRTLELGHRDAGIYASRSKAAYWDGRNESGEVVASGIYFYSITASEYTATRKMTITR